MFMHKGYAQNIFKSLVGEAKLGSSEMRWHSEQLVYNQLSNVGAEIFFRVVDACFERDVSPESVKKLLALRPFSGLIFF